MSNTIACENRSTFFDVTKRVSASSKARLSGAQKSQSSGARLEGFLTKLTGEEREPPRRSGYFGQPLAPASTKTLIFVSVLVLLLMLPAASINNDFLAVGACVLVAGLGMVVLDVHGRQRAKLHPHPLLRSDRLPEDSRMMRVFIYSLSAALLVAFMLLLYSMKRQPTPYPFFLTVAFLFLIAPQLQAKRAIRLYDAEHGRRVPPQKSEDSVAARSVRKRRRRRHKR